MIALDNASPLGVARTREFGLKSNPKLQAHFKLHSSWAEPAQLSGRARSFLGNLLYNLGFGAASPRLFAGLLVPKVLLPEILSRLVYPYLLSGGGMWLVFDA